MEALAHAPDTGWEARLELGYERRADRTVPTRRAHRGPLVVQRPFYPEGNVCHTYVIHPPGGVVGGDSLELDVEVGEAAHALVTTPASAKFYRSAGPLATQTQALRVRAGGILEWLPQDTILFDGCRVETLTRVDLDAGAGFIGWELVCLGRPASGDHYGNGVCRQRLELWRAGVPLLLECSHFDGGSAALDAPWGLAGRRVTGTLLAVGADAAARDAVREALPSNALAGATLVDDVLVCRALGAQAQELLRTFTTAWEVLRPLLLDRPACEPRVWNT
jgi:urease accessory protein